MIAILPSVRVFAALLGFESLTIIFSPAIGDTRRAAEPSEPQLLRFVAERTSAYCSVLGKLLPIGPSRLCVCLYRRLRRCGCRERCRVRSWAGLARASSSAVVGNTRFLEPGLRHCCPRPRLLLGSLEPLI